MVLDYQSVDVTEAVSDIDVVFDLGNASGGSGRRRQREPERLGRSGGRSAGPSLGVVVNRRQRSGLGPVEVQTTVEMVDLVLDDTGRPPREDLVDWLTMLVEGLDPDGAVSGHDPGDTGNAQAPLVKAHQVVIMHRLQCRIDQDGEGQRVSFPCRSIFFAQLSPSLRAVLKHGELERHSDLGGGQTHPRCRVHGRPHQDDKTLQLGSTKVGGVDRLGTLAKDRVSALDDW